MKILLTVEFYNPHKGGAEKVIEDLAISLVERGHDVSVATTFLKDKKNNLINGIFPDMFTHRPLWLIIGMTAGYLYLKDSNEKLESINPSTRL